MFDFIMHGVGYIMKAKQAQNYVRARLGHSQSKGGRPLVDWGAFERAMGELERELGEIRSCLGGDGIEARIAGLEGRIAELRAMLVT